MSHLSFKTYLLLCLELICGIKPLPYPCSDVTVTFLLVVSPDIVWRLRMSVSASVMTNQLLWDCDTALWPPFLWISQGHSWITKALSLFSQVIWEAPWSGTSKVFPSSWAGLGAGTAEDQHSPVYTPETCVRSADPCSGSGAWKQGS